jgi:glycine/D-amino acid oxidase-like deaminating enzyme
LHVAIGCSGHGFKLAPALGAIVARGITGETSAFDTAMDPRFLEFDREPIRLTAMNVLA